MSIDLTTKINKDLVIVEGEGFPTYCVITDKGTSVVYPYVDRETYLKDRFDVVHPLVDVFYHDEDCYHLWKDKHGNVMCSLYETHEDYLELLKWYEEQEEKW
jgi:hypothetical protein